MLIMIFSIYVTRVLIFVAQLNSDHNNRTARIIATILGGSRGVSRQPLLVRSMGFL